MTEKNTNVKNNQVQPATVDRLSAHEDWTFTDATCNCRQFKRS